MPYSWAARRTACASYAPPTVSGMCGSAAESNWTAPIILPLSVPAPRCAAPPGGIQYAHDRQRFLRRYGRRPLPPNRVAQTFIETAIVARPARHHLLVLGRDQDAVRRT